MKQWSPILFRCFFAIFGVIGLSILISMWSAPFGEFGSPPLFFRITASLIALAFMAMGFGVAFSKGAPQAGEMLSKLRQNSSASTKSKQYECPHCAGGIGDQEVSPSGDVKCQYCGKWYNVHAR